MWSDGRLVWGLAWPIQFDIRRRPCEGRDCRMVVCRIQLAGKEDEGKVRGWYRIGWGEAGCLER